ncbi:MAG TPA: GspE/PulE family protein [Xanthobacteraceae bacterium]
MSQSSTQEFWRYLLDKYSAPTAVPGKTKGEKPLNGEISLRAVLESTQIPVGDFANEVARFWDRPRILLPQLLAANGLISRFSRRFLVESTVFPFEGEDGPKLAVADPTDTAALRAAEIVLGGAVEVVVASFEDIATVLGERLDDDESGGATAADAALAHSDDDIESLRDLASGAPAVRALNDLFERATELRASDIHVEPGRSGLVVRMRVDGLLRSVPTPVGALPQALISRIKILAGLNIAERRLPQDGAARVRVGRAEIDIRVATMPTQHGESAVLRLLPRDRGLLDIGKLGLAAADEKKLTRLLALPHGMIVITGPTGSGKTTTLATMLSILNEPTRKILTIEDPVEYEIPGINQSQVKPAIGLTFAAAMRSFVRQDPDVIMVGEVRDPETANIAIHAALTGHLVLTTLHTETAAAAVPRLIDLGVESFLLQSTLRAVIAQRLVRVLCERCKVRKVLGPGDIAADPRYEILGFAPGETVCEPVGCERCGGVGYRGRNGVFELLQLDDEIRRLMGQNTDSKLIHTAAARSGMTSMAEDAIAKCRAGMTSAAEVLRVTTIG